MPRLEVKLRSSQEVITSKEADGEAVEHLRHYLNLLTETDTIGRSYDTQNSRH